MQTYYITTISRPTIRDGTRPSQDGNVDTAYPVR